MQFNSLFLELEKTKSELSTLLKSDHNGWIAEKRRLGRERAWKDFAKTSKGKNAKLPKNEIDIVLKLCDLADVYNGELITWMFERWNSLKTKEKSLESQLYIAAQDAEVHTGDNWFILGSSDTGTYSSQGWGADRYAKNSAESIADQARFYHIPVKIECERRQYGSTYKVYVQVRSKLDTEVLRRKNGPSLVEWVQLCWKRGVNPRVYNPFLPHGFEERHKISYL